ncbi:MAG: RNA polymerase sigma-I factor [Eubacteriales bacterium]
MAVSDCVMLAQGGDENAREELIKYYKSFIRNTSCGICKRGLDWDNDDELSVALLAFNEAINAYSPERGAGFLNFARRVINQRLIDYFRLEKRHQYLPLNEFSDQETKSHLIEDTQSMEEYQRKKEQEDLAEMMFEFDQCLAEYGVSLGELADVCPKHRDTREKLLEVAKILCSNENLLSSFRHNRRLPVGSLARLANVSTRVLDKGRRYLVALVIIMSDQRFLALRSFVDLE